MTPSEAADYFDVSRPTIYKMIKDGRLHAERISERKQRIDMDSFDLYIGAPGRTRLLRAVADWMDDCGLTSCAFRLRWMVKNQCNWHEQLLWVYDDARRLDAPLHIIGGLNQLLALTPRR